MKLKFFTFVFFVTLAFLLQFNDAAGQEKLLPKTSCESYIEIHGSSNVNQFHLINHNPKIVRLSDRGDDEKHDQRIEISVNQFKGANKRIRKDFLKMVNASKYPFIIMTIEPRNLAECRKNKGLSDFKTKITIAGVSQRFVVPCGVDTCESSGYVLKGSLEVKLTDFGIDPPKKFFGLVKVNNEVLIDYVFRFQTDDAIFRLPIDKQTGFNTINDGFIDGGWQDTFLLLPGLKIRIALKFEDFTGIVVYHCHNLEHEDMGMMRNYEVVG